MQHTNSNIYIRLDSQEEILCLDRGRFFTYLIICRAIMQQPGSNNVKYTNNRARYGRVLFKTFDQQTKSFLDKVRTQIYESIAKAKMHALIVADF